MPKLKSDPNRQERCPEPAANSFPRPFLKWAGGKTQLLSQFERFYPRERIERYIEPFLGGGAVFFHVKGRLHPTKALLSDNNEELIKTFQAVKTNVEAVICALRIHKERHSPDYYRMLRNEPADDLVACAARLIYLNKTCFNGLYRVNSKGVFNVPMGRYANPVILDENGLREASRQLRGVELSTRDFRVLPKIAKKNDFVYLDPPYLPISKTSNFTSYTRTSFGDEDHWKLSRVYGKLCEAGCYVMLSNSDNPSVEDLYRGFGKDVHIHHVSARRSINSRIERRGQIRELVIVNYPLRGT